MSYDLYFFKPHPSKPWAELVPHSDLDEVDVENMPALDDAAIATWTQTTMALQSLLPSAKEFIAPSNREMNDDATGIQISIFGGDLTLTVPYWFEGAQAEELVERMRQVVDAVEKATGLVAYDPQADAAFLAESARTAAARLSSTRRAVIQHLESQPDPTTPEPSSVRKRRRNFAASVPQPPRAHRRER